jgi:hypothetical protein
MQLFDRHFPDDLADRCKLFSGRVNLTDAVKDSLQRLFEIECDYRSLKLKYKDKSADYEDLFRLFDDMIELEKRKQKVFEQLKQPDRFRLHGD